jgi:hypothetical protein
MSLTDLINKHIKVSFLSDEQQKKLLEKEKEKLELSKEKLKSMAMDIFKANSLEGIFYNKGYEKGVIFGNNALSFLNSKSTFAINSKKALKKANQLHPVPGGINTLLTIAAVESQCGSVYRENEGANKTNNHYTGLFQMGKNEAISVGYTYRDGGPKDLHGTKAKNIENNAIAGAKLLLRRKQDNPFDMYLAHQQGSGGRNNLIKKVKNNPNEKLYPFKRNTQKSRLYGNFSENFLGSKAKQQLTFSQWYYYWKGRIEGVSSVMPNSL